MTTILIVTGIVLGIIIFSFYARSKKPIKNALIGMITGGIGLIVVNLFGSIISISLSLNIFNTVVALLLGIPGVVFMVIGKIILV